MFGADSYFHIGKAHLVNGKPCQDFALSEIGTRAAYAVVADGCSSGGQTDLGARVVALGTTKALKEILARKEILISSQMASDIAEKRFGTMLGAKDLFNLRYEDLLATCGYIVATENAAFINLVGDGVIVKKTLDGRLIAHCYTWAWNTPLYPIYATDEYKSFLAAHGDNETGKVFREECWTLGSDGVWSLVKATEFAARESLQGVSLMIDGAELRSLEFLALFSDGVMQIDNVDWKEAVRSLMAFKNTMGEFAKRRMTRFIKDVQTNGRGPLDDISYAVIHLVGKEAQDGGTNE